MPRGFGPTRIASWLDQAESLSQNSRTADLGFLVAFTTWEALQCRILAVALRQQGYSMAVAHEYLGSSVHNDRIPIRQIFEFVLLKAPQQVSGIGKGWRELESHRTARNRFAHGLGTLSPAELGERSSKIVFLLRDTHWLEITPVPNHLGDSESGWTNLGPVMSSLRSVPSNGYGPQHVSNQIRKIRESRKITK